MKIGERVKVHVTAPPHAFRRHRIGTETLWVEVLEAPDAAGRWAGKLLNKPLFIPAEWGDLVSVVTDLDASGPTSHRVDTSPYAAVDLDETREYTDASESVSETLERLKKKGCACCGGPLHDG
jgi:hypothetical protein